MFEVVTLRDKSGCGLRPCEVATGMMTSGFSVYFDSNDLKPDSGQLCLYSTIEIIRNNPD